MGRKRRPASEGGITFVRTRRGEHLCTGCGQPIKEGQEYWDELDLPWHFRCVPERPVRCEGDIDQLQAM